LITYQKIYHVAKNIIEDLIGEKNDLLINYWSSISIIFSSL